MTEEIKRLESTRDRAAAKLRKARDALKKAREKLREERHDQYVADLDERVRVSRAHHETLPQRAEDAHAKHIGGMTYKAIAAEAGITLHAARTLVHKHRRILIGRANQERLRLEKEAEADAWRAEMERRQQVMCGPPCQERSMIHRLFAKSLGYAFAPEIEAHLQEWEPDALPMRVENGGLFRPGRIITAAPVSDEGRAVIVRYLRPGAEVEFTSLSDYELESLETRKSLLRKFGGLS